MASWSQLSLFWLLVEAGEPAHARFLALPLLLKAKKKNKNRNIGKCLLKSSRFWQDGGAFQDAWKRLQRSEKL